MTPAPTRSIALIPPRSGGHARSLPDTQAASFGLFSPENPAESVDSLHAAREVKRLVTWAGWLSEEADPETGFFPRDFRAWSPEGWDRLRAGIERQLDANEAAGQEPRSTLCLRPAAGCIVGDPQACLTFLREKRRPGIELLLDLPSMLTPDMLGELEDHAGRAFAALGDQESVVGSVLAAPVADRATDRIRLEPLSDHPQVGGVILDAWRRSPLADRWVLIVDPRDAALLA